MAHTVIHSRITLPGDGDFIVEHPLSVNTHNAELLKKWLELLFLKMSSTVDDNRGTEGAAP